MEEALKEILKQLGDLKEGQTRLESRLDRMDDRFDRLEKGQSRLESDIGQLKEGQANLQKAVFQAFQETEEAADKKTAENTTAIETLNKRVFTVESAITRLERKQA